MGDAHATDAIERLATVYVAKEAAAAFLDGGVVPVGDGELQDGAVDHLRYAQALNEIDLSTRLNLLKPTEGTPSCRYFLDTYYKRLIEPVEPNSVGIYGPEAACWTPPDLAFQSGRMAHVPFRSVPIIAAESTDELAEVINRIRQWLPAGLQVWFRGQNKPYWIRRPAVVNELLYGRTDVLEPSLQSSSARATDGTSARFWDASLALQGWFYGSAWAAADAELPEVLEMRHSEMHLLRASNEWIVSVMCLLQHYGVPTAGLDVSTDVDVATWFATHALTIDGAGRGHYTPRTPSEDRANPVVYVFGGPADHVVDLSTTTIAGRVQAKRPIAQKGLMTLGGWGINANIAAEDLIAIIELAPDFPRSRIPYRELFPSPVDDLGYGLMLGFRRLAAAGDAPQAFRDVIEFE